MGIGGLEGSGGKKKNAPQFIPNFDRSLALAIQISVPTLRAMQRHNFGILCLVLKSPSPLEAPGVFHTWEGGGGGPHTFWA